MLCVGFFPSVRFCAGEQACGLTSRFHSLIVHVACLIKSGGSQGY